MVDIYSRGRVHSYGHRSIRRPRRTLVTPHPHRRRGRWAAALALAAATVVSVPFAAHIAAAATVPVTVDPNHPAGQLPSDFLGLSYEESIVAGTALDSTKGNLGHLLDTLTPNGHLR